MSPREKVLLIFNIVIYTSLTVFSYAYVDLNLTLSRSPNILSFTKIMQQLGYYHRPVATLFYLLFLIIAFCFFIFNLYLFYKSKVGINYLISCTLINTAILIFAYPFLSSDLFNYLFDAKIILVYHVSPYIHKPLDFPTDEWLRFMRWTHRYSPYGPLWLLMSLIPAGLGFGKFILNFFAFKIFISLFHLINSFLIFKILTKLNLKFSTFGTAFYALNPLFLIEGVANAHNDVVLATFIILPLYFLVNKKFALSYVSLIAGVAVKYIPILNLPWLIWMNLASPKKDVQQFIILNIITLTIFTYLFSSFRITVPFVSSGATQVQFQPWYLFWTLPLISLIPNVWFVGIAISLSLGASLRYLSYLYYGDWNHYGITQFMTLVTFIPILFFLAFWSVKKFLINRKYAVKN